MLLPLFILSSLIERLRILVGNGFGGLNLGFVSTMVFYHLLSLDLICGGVGGLTSSENPLISLLYIEIRL